MDGNAVSVFDKQANLATISLPIDEFRTQSESISKISLAVSRAQAKMAAAKRTARNPFFNSSYADLGAVWDAVREPLAESELAVIQMPIEDGRGTAIITTLAHSSGEWFRSKLYITPKAKDAQSVGSAITYARRYALSAITGVAPDDDDGERAMQGSHENVKAKAVETTEPKPKNPEWKAGPQPAVIPIGVMIAEIRDWLGEMNGHDPIKVDDMLKEITKWKAKDTGEEKFLTMEGLSRIKKEDWIKRIHDRVANLYNTAQQ